MVPRATGRQREVRPTTKHEQADQSRPYLTTSTGDEGHLDPRPLDGTSDTGRAQKDSADRDQGGSGTLFGVVFVPRSAPPHVTPSLSVVDGGSPQPISVEAPMKYEDASTIAQCADLEDRSAKHVTVDRGVATHPSARMRWCLRPGSGLGP